MTQKNDTVKISSEKKLIYLLLNDKYCLERFFTESVPVEFFEEENRPIVSAIIQSYQRDGVKLTRNSFIEQIKQLASPKERVLYEFSFNRCFSAITVPDEYPLLLDKLYDKALHDQINISLDKLRENLGKLSKVACIKQLSSDCDNMISKISVKDGESYYDDIRQLSAQRIAYIQDVRSGKIIEEPPLVSGIKEIDDTMVTGLQKGTLTLFSADVGGFKSTMILNIGLNVWRQGYNVLFVPLEMHKDQMWNKACAREAKINSEILYKNLKDLPEEQVQKIIKMQEDWDTLPAKFYIMQEPGRITVNKIHKSIEAHLDIFKPRLVVIDYVANLEADKSRYGRNDLEIGDMLKEMREMGKVRNFAVISAAQLGREALKRIRKAVATKDKAQIHSEDIRGSHEYSADADNIYAMLPHPHEPRSKLDLFVVKARNGRPYFNNGDIKATLSIKPEMSYIYTDDYADNLSDLNTEVPAKSEDGRAEEDKKINEIVYQQEQEEKKEQLQNKDPLDAEWDNIVPKKSINVHDDPEMDF